MKSLAKTTIAALALTAISAPAMASGPEIIPVAPPVIAPAAHDWSGAYIGGYLASAYTNTNTALGLRLGYNFQSGSFVYGAELDAFSNLVGTAREVFVNVRAGYAAGSNTLLFASLGRGRFNGALNLHSIGLGAEYAVSDPLSIRFDVERHNTLGTPLLSGPTFVKLGASWGF